MTQPYLSYRCWLLHAQAVSAAPAASFKSANRTVEELPADSGSRTADGSNPLEE